MARYEAREVDANVQMQRIALQCREEAATLKRTNEALAKRCQVLEKQLEVARTLPVHASAAAGCLPPVHEQTGQRSRSSSLDSPRPSTSVATPTPTTVFPSLAHQPSMVSEDEPTFDCGFCTEQNLCVCRGKAKLELDAETMDEELAPMTVPLIRPSAPAVPLRPPAPAFALRPPAPAVPLPRPSPPEARLWPTVASTASPAARRKIWNTWAAPVRPSLASVSRARTRPWTATEAEQPSPRPTRAAAVCTGDQRTCGACNQDPSLAQFCSEVTRNVRVPTSDQPRGPSPEPSPTASTPERESVPQAFTRLRNHPNFTQWNDDRRLQMLAEVVSRDTQPKAGHASPDLGASGGSPMARPASATSPPAVRSARRAAPDDDTLYRKRARYDDRVYVRTNAVSDALALLDHTGTEDDEVPGTYTARPCPCPWVTPSSRLPWPRGQAG